MPQRLSPERTVYVPSAASRAAASPREACRPADPPVRPSAEPSSALSPRCRPVPAWPVSVSPEEPALCPELSGSSLFVRDGSADGSAEAPADAPFPPDVSDSTDSFPASAGVPEGRSGRGTRRGPWPRRRQERVWSRTPGRLGARRARGVRSARRVRRGRGGGGGRGGRLRRTVVGGAAADRRGRVVLETGEQSAGGPGGDALGREQLLGHSDLLRPAGLVGARGVVEPAVPLPVLLGQLQAAVVAVAAVLAPGAAGLALGDTVPRRAVGRAGTGGSEERDRDGGAGDSGRDDEGRGLAGAAVTTVPGEHAKTFRRQH